MNLDRASRSEAYRAARRGRCGLRVGAFPLVARGCVGLALCAGVVASAHALDSSSAAGQAPTLFRCETRGHITYSDRPCADAQKVQALRLSGGSHVAGADSGTWRSYAVAGYGNRLGRSVDPECPHLAQRMALVEAEEQRATADTIGLVQQRLAVQRSRFRELACDGRGPIEGAG